MDSQSKTGNLSNQFRDALRGVVVGRYYQTPPQIIFEVNDVRFPNDGDPIRQDIFLVGYIIDPETGLRTTSNPTLMPMNFKYLSRDFCAVPQRILEKIAAANPSSPETSSTQESKYPQDQVLRNNITRGMSPQGA